MTRKQAEERQSAARGEVSSQKCTAQVWCPGPRETTAEH